MKSTQQIYNDSEMSKKIIKRRAPKKGYDNGTKQNYRKAVWSYMSNKCLPLLSDKDAMVLLLPSKEGLEIDVAISFGVRPEQIIAIDENPALIAVSSWRKKHPDVKYFGCKVSEVGPKIKAAGWYLAGANLDFCNNFSEELIFEVNEFLKNTPKSTRFNFCVTMGRGRESKALLLLLKHLKTPDVFQHPRMAALFELMDDIGRYKGLLDYKDTLSLDFEESYFDTFPMIYAGFSLNPIDVEIYRNEIDRINLLWNRKKRLERPISKTTGFNLPRVKYLKEKISEMVSGEYFNDYKIPLSNEEKEKKLEATRGELAIQLKYNKWDISDFDLRVKRGHLVDEVERQRFAINDKVEASLSAHCYQNNIINKEKYIRSHLHELYNSRYR